MNEQDLKTDPALTISEFGEKRLIREILRPLFRNEGETFSIGDDCALLDIEPDHYLLTSTDRVPADLIAFRLGIIDHYGLGRYLASLNISDIAACGGKPLGLLLNFGLPKATALADFIALCEGAKSVAGTFNFPIIGGDLSASAELSISATSLGSVRKGRQLMRSAAEPGDTVFVSRPIGLTPAAFEFYRAQLRGLAQSEIDTLNQQFSLLPMVDLGNALSNGPCRCCMDNTDGLAQSLSEIAELSGCKIVLDRLKLVLPDVVHKVASLMGCDAVDLALGPGADFALVGTLEGHWEQSEALRVFGEAIRIVGHVEAGDGLFISDGVTTASVAIRGWSYFEPQRLQESP